MQERDNIINFLLQQCDLKNRSLELYQTEKAELQKRIAELEKQLGLEPQAGPEKVNGKAYKKSPLPETVAKNE